MDMVMTLVWYPWTEGQGGPAGTQGAFRTLDLRIDDAEWPRLPNVGETIFFDDGGSAAIEAVGWKLDGTAYLYLGKRYEKRGDLLDVWVGRGFTEREVAPPAAAAPVAGQVGPVAAAQMQATSGAPGAGAAGAAAGAAGANAPTVPTQLPPMPGDQAAG